jgi:hypothetical protein
MRQIRKYERNDRKEKDMKVGKKIKKARKWKARRTEEII